MKTQQPSFWTSTETPDVSIFQITGLGKQNGVCDDRVLYQESDTATYYGIADGMSGKRFSGLGADLSLHITQQFIEEQGISEMIDRPFHDELPGELVKRLRNGFMDAMEQLGCKLDDLASTLLLIAIDRQTKQYVIVHIGDGAVLGVRKSGEIQFISEPDNPMGGGFTWMTTGLYAINHTRYLFESAHDLKRIVLVSDGADMICLRKSFSLRAGRLIKQGSRRDIQDYLLHYRPADDASCIVVDFPSGGDDSNGNKEENDHEKSR